jgi:hypothetical protein
MFVVRLVRSVRRASLAAAAVAAAGLAAACSRGAETPEELFELGREWVSTGRHGEFYDHLSTEQRADFERRMDGMRETLRRNPGARNLASQFQVSYEEFLTLPYPELWIRAHRGTEPAMVGARIIDRTTDPVTGRDVAITFETSGGQQFRWIMRFEDGRGWTFQAQIPVKLETRRDP